jgi:hypothetical protein
MFGYAKRNKSNLDGIVSFISNNFEDRSLSPYVKFFQQANTQNFKFGGPEITATPKSD